MKKKNVTAICCIIILFQGTILFSQNSKIISAAIQVEGVCDMCKTRIENAAYIKGVKKCDWDKESGILTVVYNPQKTDQKKIENSIADSGHSTENQATKEEAYQNLPKCCAYLDGVEKH